MTYWVLVPPPSAGAVWALPWESSSTRQSAEQQILTTERAMAIILFVFDIRTSLSS
jgi:hypothetical protein